MNQRLPFRSVTARSNDRPTYVVSSNDDHVIAQALKILEGRMREPGQALCNPEHVKDYLRLKIGDKEREVFAVVFLDVMHRVIECQEMFMGTLTQTSVYPREVAREALLLGASAVILSHNHPSGSPTPSRADEALTQTLKTTLALIDVRVLDHVIVTASESLSMAERGLV